MKKINAGSLLTGIRSSLVIAGLLIVFIISIVLLFANFTYLNTQSNHDKQYVGRTDELCALLQRIVKNATEAAAGKGEAFKFLEDARNDLEKRWSILVNGDKSTSLPSSPEAVKPQMDAMQQGRGGLRKNADPIPAGGQTIPPLHQVASTLAETIPQLQTEYEEVVDILLENSVPADQVAVAQCQSLSAGRILGSVNRVPADGENSVQVTDNSGRNASLLGRVLEGIQEDNAAMNISGVTSAEAVDRLSEIAELFEFASGSVDEILETSPDLFRVREATNSIFSVSQTLPDETSQLVDGFEDLADGRSINPFAGYVLGVLALTPVILIGLVMMHETNRRLTEIAEKNDRSQAAILRLLDETADLADGDLTVAATVIEDFTGAITDSVNYSTDQLRELVETINQAAVQMATVAQETQFTVMHLARTSKHQAQEIAGVSATISEMAVSIDQALTSAPESLTVAEYSVAITNKGNEVMYNIVAGMDSIRKQIQGASERIKRLDKSSQEIGNIVGLINDIVGQTDIPALNTAIQALMAEDTGHGFAVVTDEVQRLAERSSTAAKQIKTLVKTIQIDTNEAMVSMEQTVSEVVCSAHLTQDAGVTLEEIGKVSETLAALIQNISNAAHWQASSADYISDTVNIVQEITSQISTGTTTIARGIGNLAEMANETRNPVSGFKPPENVGQA